MPAKTATLSSNKAASASRKSLVPAPSAVATADPEAFYKEMGALIGHFRRKAKLTQEELAKTIGLTRSSVTNIESGIQTPLPYALAQMADVLKVRIEQLFPVPGSAGEEFKATLEKLDPKSREVIERFMGRF